MALLDGYGTFFGATGSPEAMRDQDMTDLLMRLQLAQAGPLPDGAVKSDVQFPFSGIAVQGGRPTPQAARNPKTIAPSADSRFLESDTQAMPSNGDMGTPAAAFQKRQDRIGATRSGVTNIPKTSAITTSRSDARRGPLTPTPPTPAPDFAPSFGERLSNFGDALTGRNYVNFADRTRARNQTYQALRKLGLDDTVAQAAVMNPKLLQAILTSKYTRGGSFGKQVIWAQNQNNEWVPMQVSSSGIGAPTRLPPGLRVVPPGDIAEQKAFGSKKGQVEGKLAAERPELFRTTRQSMTNLRGQWKDVRTAIDTAREIITRNQRNGTLPATGWGAWIDWLPGTDALALRNALETVKANIGFDKLQAMRDASPTGGALGQVSEFENRLLQAVRGSLSQDQDAKTLLGHLERIRGDLGGLQKDREEAFKQQFGIPQDYRMAPDGFFYAPDPTNPGQYRRWRAPNANEVR